MPPKKRMVDRSEDSELESELITSPISSASSYTSTSTASAATTRSTISLSSEQLEAILSTNSKNLQDSSARILESNQKAMADLIASLSPASSGSRPVRSVQIKPPKWSDEEIPYDYFGKYEKAMLHSGIEKSSWGQLLPVYLTGRAQAALAQVDVAALDDYDTVKSILLASLGDTPTSADRKWWSLNRQPGEEPGSFYLRVRSLGLRRLHGMTSKDEVVEHMILSRYLSLLSAECYGVVVNMHPKTGLDAARMVQEYEETRTFTKKRQPWKQDSYQHLRREPGVVSSGGSSGSGRSSPGGGCGGMNARIYSRFTSTR